MHLLRSSGDNEIPCLFVHLEHRSGKEICKVKLSYWWSDTSSFLWSYEDVNKLYIKWVERASYRWQVKHFSSDRLRTAFKQASVFVCYWINKQTVNQLAQITDRLCSIKCVSAKITHQSPSCHGSVCRWQAFQMWAGGTNKGFTPAQMLLMKTATRGAE